MRSVHVTDMDAPLFYFCCTMPVAVVNFAKKIPIATYCAKSQLLKLKR